MVTRTTRSGTGRAAELWPVLLLLFVVAVPTIGILWFLGIAVENQRLATQAQLTEAYRLHLENVQRETESYWAASFDRARQWTSSSALPPGDGPGAGFAKLLHLEFVDSAILFDASGALQYPKSESAPAAEPQDPRWPLARKYENTEGRTLEAQQLYATIALEATTTDEKVLATQAQVRCLVRRQRQDEAWKLIDQLGEATEGSLTPSARAIQANMELMAVEAMGAEGRQPSLRERLLTRVGRYDAEGLQPAQRLFMMRRLKQIGIAGISPDMLLAEDLAARFASRPRHDGRAQTFRRTEVPDVWAAMVGDGLLLLSRAATLRQATEQAVAAIPLPEGVAIELLAPDELGVRAELLSRPLNTLAGWRLVLAHRGPAAATATRQWDRFTFWIGILVVLFTSVTAVVIASAIRQQLRLANLKNDLVGTVSHELKTPLSSMRLLVDTLLDRETFDPDTTRRYLQLISKENTRLSRLIENFLTFTRMDQGRHALAREEARPADIAREAIEAVGERLRNEEADLQLDVAEDLPTIHADADALVMALLNLLDNALKYSQSPREIGLQVQPRGDAVCFAVSDNGVGIASADLKHVFERFFQVDQRLDRESKGCGLGLSIVDTIVRGHGGTVSVESTPGEGSTFEFSIPASSSRGNQ